MRTGLKNNKRIGILITVILIIVLACAGLGAYKFYQHEKKQSQQIADLQGKVDLLNSKMQDRSQGIVWNDGEFNYLAIGNSITRHGKSSYWWNGENGMAASDEVHDYFHLVLKHLEEKYGKVHGETAGISTWEVRGHDRDETFFLFDSYLDSGINLITIQLGENASNLTTFEKDYESMIRYLQSKCPKARILVIGDFWGKDNRDELKAEAAKNTGAEYVSLEGIKDNKEYFAGMGTTVYDEEGNAHSIDHAGVADHPGDRGMAAIAERIIEIIDKEAIGD